jgi:hypothetical protein
MSRKKIPPNLQIWIDVRQRYHLSHAHVQMARELGLNPRKFGRFANHRQERWKLPLPQFIEKLYLKSFGKAAPDEVVSIEERARRLAAKKAQRKAARAAAQNSEAGPKESSNQGIGDVPF